MSGRSLYPIVVTDSEAELGDIKAVMTAHDSNFFFCTTDHPLAVTAEIAICWAPPPGAFSALPNLRLIHSVGAGVDALIREPSLPTGVPVCRIVDPSHCQGMLQYVLWGVLHFHRRFDEVLRSQSQGQWSCPAQRAASETCVGVMGLGHLGMSSALQIASMGFETRGWARSKREVEGVVTFEDSQLDQFLSGIDILICLLPLTEQTEGILGSRTFDLMAAGAAIINCGRGGHLNSADLIAALASGKLRGALLDVFDHEPLSQEDVLWHTPGVVVTPHMASSASNEVIAAQILKNIELLAAGMPLVNVVNTQAGY